MIRSPPTAWHGPIAGLCGSLRDVDHVGDPVLTLTRLARRPAQTEVLVAPANVSESGFRAMSLSPKGGPVEQGRGRPSARISPHPLAPLPTAPLGRRSRVVGFRHSCMEGNARRCAGVGKRRRRTFDRFRMLVDRVVAGIPLNVGDLDGRGRFGTVEETEDGLVCHECGKASAHLGLHAFRGHGITAADYRRQHGVCGQAATDHYRCPAADPRERHSQNERARRQRTSNSSRPGTRQPRAARSSRTARGSRRAAS